MADIITHYTGSCQLVVWQQVVVIEFGKDTTQQTKGTFARANLLQTCYRKTGAMDFGRPKLGRPRLNHDIWLLNLLSLHRAIGLTD